MNYVVFCKPSCPFCIKAVDLLNEKQKTFNVVNFKDEHAAVLDELKEAMDWRTVPMVFLRSDNNFEFIGGFTDLEKHLQDG